jgi:hypothetical protein
LVFIWYFSCLSYPVLLSLLYHFHHGFVSIKVMFVRFLTNLIVSN